MHLPEKLSLPCQPRVVALLMNELRSTNPSLRRLNQLFGSDPVLAAWLLEQANADHPGFRAKTEKGQQEHRRRQPRRK